MTRTFFRIAVFLVLFTWAVLFGFASLIALSSPPDTYLFIWDDTTASATQLGWILAFAALLCTALLLRLVAGKSR